MLPDNHSPILESRHWSCSHNQCRCRLFVHGQVVLSCTQDDFFARNRFSNFGDLGVAVKTLMDDYQKATRLNENINSIEDMQAFLERYVSRRFCCSIRRVHQILSSNLNFVGSLVQAVSHTKRGRVVTHIFPPDSTTTDNGPEPPGTTIAMLRADIRLSDRSPSTCPSTLLF